MNCEECGKELTKEYEIAHDLCSHCLGREFGTELKEFEILEELDRRKSRSPESPDMQSLRSALAKRGKERRWDK